MGSSSRACILKVTLVQVRRSYCGVLTMLGWVLFCFSFNSTLTYLTSLYYNVESEVIDLAILSQISFQTNSPY
jgi:hypothetical protein